MTMKSGLGTTFAFLVATSGAVFAESHATHPVTGEVLSSNQSFTYSVLDESRSIDPGLAEDSAGGDILRDLFEGLYNQDASGNPEPGVAFRHTVSDDNLVYTFTLRANAKWSNGDPVTAGDFEYAWKRVASPELASPYSWFLEKMALENASQVIAGDVAPSELGVKAIDDTTLEVRLTRPVPHLPLMLTHFTTFPVHQVTVEVLGPEWTMPGNMVSNGAYVLTEHVPLERLVRERNRMYWDNDSTIIEKVTSLVISNENVALTRYLAGELDRTHVPAGQFPRLSAQFPAQAISVPEACSYYYMFNLRDSAPAALQDPDVRKALGLAIDRDVIVNDVLSAGQRAAYTFTHWATAGFETPEIEMATMTQSARNAMAQALLAQAGYGADNPLNINLIYNTSETHKAVAVAVSQMWKQTLGVETILASQDWQSFIDARSNGDFEVAGGGWCADFNEASTFLDLVQSEAGYNHSRYVNPEIDALLADARTARNPQSDYSAVEQIIAQDTPVIPVYHSASAHMYTETLEGWPYENFQQQWYSKDLYKIAE